jgi:hypothetical protein
MMRKRGLIVLIGFTFVSVSLSTCVTAKTDVPWDFVGHQTTEVDGTWVATYFADYGSVYAFSTKGPGQTYIYKMGTPERDDYAHRGYFRILNGNLELLPNAVLGMGKKDWAHADRDTYDAPTAIYSFEISGNTLKLKLIGGTTASKDTLGKVTEYQKQ